MSIRYLRFRSRAKGRPFGYTTLEVTIALSLAGLLLGIGALNFQGAIARERADGWARALTYDIAAGRQAAVTRRTTVTVTTTTTTYTIAAVSGGTLRQQTLPSDITMSTTCPFQACSFDRRGVPVAAGTITLTSVSTGRTYVITIQSGTGRVSYREQ